MWFTVASPGPGLVPGTQQIPSKYLLIDRAKVSLPLLKPFPPPGMPSLSLLPFRIPPIHERLNPNPFSSGKPSLISEVLASGLLPSLTVLPNLRYNVGFMAGRGCGETKGR